MSPIMQNSKQNRKKHKNTHKNAHKDSGHSSKPSQKTTGKSGQKGQPSSKKLSIDLFGVHAVQEAWNNPKRFVHALYLTDNAAKSFPLDTPAERPHPIIVSKEDLDKSLPPGTTHQGVAMACQDLEENDIQDLMIATASKERSLFVMLDQVTDPHNVGAILRSACAFGADGLIMQRKHAPMLNGILAKTASGAAEHVPVAYETNLSRTIEVLQKENYFVIGLDERGQDLKDLPSYERCVLVLGAEGPGIRPLVKDHCDILAKLPTQGPISSLNVSNAAAVALYEIGIK